MTRYDDVDHQPPAPVARVSIEHPSSGAKVSDIPMLIDSGADVTLLPVSMIARLGLLLDTDKGYELEGFEQGSKKIACPAMAVMELGDFRFRGSYLFRESEIGILGRNILNRVVLELNGPGLTWSMRKS